MDSELPRMVAARNGHADIVLAILLHGLEDEAGSSS